MKEPILLLFCFITLAGSAQSTFSLQAGYNNAHFSKQGGGSISSETNYPSINSFHLGIAAEMGLGKNFFLAPALLYFGNGSRITDYFLSPGGELIDNLTVRLNYLRLPVNILIKINAGRPVHFFFGAGLYVARGLFGTQKGSSESSFAMNAATAVTIDQKIKFTTGYSGSEYNRDPIWISPYDFGYTFSAGVEWKKCKLMPSFSNGLVAAHRGEFYDLKNSSFSISLEYELTNHKGRPSP